MMHESKPHYFKFFSLEELNVAIGELLEKLNRRPFRKKDGTRAAVWEAIDKPALKPLPMEPFDLSEWSRARVNIDYHVTFDARGCRRFCVNASRCNLLGV
jgi:hypothetical protein